MSGRLVLGATPIGNPGDASQRLRQALAEADVVAAEDTRRTRRLARDLDVEIGGDLVSFYEAMERHRIPQLLRRMHEGATVLVVTDAGTPAISDPGYRIVAACAAEAIPVTTLPGPSAAIAALAVSGLPSDRFCFEGFAPRQPGALRDWLAMIDKEERTIVFFDSPRRLAKTLTAAVDLVGADRRAVICRELTKTHEEIVRGTFAELATWAEDEVRGEIVVVVEGATPTPEQGGPVDWANNVAELLEEGMARNDALKHVARRFGVARQQVYDAVVTSRKP